MSEMRLPPRIYKYQSITQNSLRNLKDRQIWFSVPRALNDPFDCANKVQVPLDDERLERLFQYYTQSSAEKVDVADWKQKYLTDGKINDRFRQYITLSINDALAIQMQRQSQGKGVACFSETFDDLLMWGHYSNGHRGFCLEFDTSVDPFSRIERVNYCNDLPVLDAVSFLIAPDSVDIFRPMMRTKYFQWAYEREWRLLHENANQPFGYHWRALTGIYLGAAMDETDEEIICMILRDSPTTLYKMFRKESGFGLDPRQFTYTPFSYEDDQ